MTARDRIVIVIVLVVAALAASWLLVIQPKRSQASKLAGQVSSAQSQLDSARTQVLQGEAAKNTFGSSYAELVRLGEAVPTNDQVPSLIYQIQNAAGASRVDFRALQVLGNTSGSSSGPSSSSSASSSATGSTAAGQASALPPGVAVGAAGFPTEQFNFTFRGNFFHLADFFHRLQKFVQASNNRVSIGGRLLTLNAISLGAAPSGFPNISATVSATTYLLPASQGLLNGATAAGPAGATSPQSVSTPSSSSTPAPPAAVIGAPVK
jgi:type II secretory pathway pseudopilin PulG